MENVPVHPTVFNHIGRINTARSRVSHMYADIYYDHCLVERWRRTPLNRLPTNQAFKLQYLGYNDENHYKLTLNYFEFTNTLQAMSGSDNK